MHSMLELRWSNTYLVCFDPFDMVWETYFYLKVKILLGSRKITPLYKPRYGFEHPVLLFFARDGQDASLGSRQVDDEDTIQG